MWNSGSMRTKVPLRQLEMCIRDSPTPVKVRTHVAEPVPYLLYDSTAPEQHDWHYNEKEAADSGRTVTVSYTHLDVYKRQGEREVF